MALSRFRLADVRRNRCRVNATEELRNSLPLRAERGFYDPVLQLGGIAVDPCGDQAIHLVDRKSKGRSLSDEVSKDCIGCYAARGDMSNGFLTPFIR